LQQDEPFHTTTNTSHPEYGISTKGVVMGKQTSLVDSS
jgi:hypothetical protein